MTVSVLLADGVPLLDAALKRAVNPNRTSMFSLTCSHCGLSLVGTWWVLTVVIPPFSWPRAPSPYVHMGGQFGGRGRLGRWPATLSPSSTRASSALPCVTCPTDCLNSPFKLGIVTAWGPLKIK